MSGPSERFGLRRRALASTALVGASLVFFSGDAPWAPRSAAAACVLGGAGAGTAEHPDTGDTVTCDGVGNVDGIAAVAGSTDVTVLIGDSGVPGTPTLIVNGVAVEVRSESTVAVANGGGIATTGDSAAAIVGIDGRNTVTLDGGFLVTDGRESPGVVLEGRRNTVTLDGGSTIRTTGDDSGGIAVEGRRASVTLDGGSAVTAEGRDGFGIYTKGANAEITLRGGSAVTAEGRDGVGIYTKGANAEITLRGGSAVTAEGRDGVGIYSKGRDATVTLRGGSTVTADRRNSVGIYVKGDRGTITLAGRSSISADGRNGNGILTTGERTAIGLDGRSSVSADGRGGVGIGAAGDRSRITLDGRASVSAGGVGGLGIGTRGERARVTLNGDSTVSAGGYYSTGLAIEGDRSRITLNDSAAVEATGPVSTGILTLGDDSSLTLNGGASVHAGNAFTYGIIARGDGTVVTLNDSAVVEATGSESLGLGLSGRNGTISLNGGSRIAATGEDTVALSIYGRNATVTLNDTSSVTNTGDDGGFPNPQAAISVGERGVSITVGENAAVTATGAGGVAIDASSRCGGGTFSLVNAGMIGSDRSTGVLGCGRAESIVNSGTIRGDGRAIDLGGGDDSLTLDTGSIIEGTVRGGGGDDLLRLVGTGAEDDRFVGFERLVVDATGTWSLSGNSSFTTIAVNSGRFAADGLLGATGGATVAAGAVLGGTGGIVGNVTNDGTLAPGNSIGTLTIDGDYVHNAGAVLEIEVESSTSFDQLLVKGAATLNGGALDILPLTALPDDFVGDVLVADGGVTGTFATVTSSDGSTVTTSYLADRVRVGKVNATTFEGRSQAVLDTGFSFLGTVFKDVSGIGGGVAGLVGPTGVEYASVGDLGAASDALASAPVQLEGRFARLWLRGFGQFGSRKDEPGAAGYGFDVAGLAAGGDWRLTPDLTVGAAVGYAKTSLDVTGNQGGTDTEGYHAAIYGEQRFGPWFAEAVLAGGYNRNDSKRRVVVAGETRTARGEFDGWQIGGRLGAGVDWGLVGAWTLRPSANLDVVSVYNEPYGETGAGAGDLDVDGDWVHAMRAGARARLSHRMETVLDGSPAVFEPRLTLGLLREIPLGDRSTTARFSGFGSGFAVEGDDTERTIATAGIGVDLQIGGATVLFADYEGEYSDDRFAHFISGGVRFTW